jgi:transcriptional regulator with XRE-family HTH domain
VGNQRTLADALRAAIRESGKPQQAIAAATGISQPALSEFLNGKRGFRLKAAERLAAYFGLELLRSRRGSGSEKISAPARS